VAQSYPWALGSLYVASYDLQGYSGDILTRLLMGQNRGRRLDEWREVEWTGVCGVIKRSVLTCEVN
jgi:hypothetical protein